MTSNMGSHYEKGMTYSLKYTSFTTAVVLLLWWQAER